MRYTYDQPGYLDVDGARHLVQELKVYIQEILNGNIDITQYATKEELSSAVSSIGLTDYAKTTDIPNLEGYATKSYVDENIANVATGGEVGLSNYVTKDTVYTKEETDAKIVQIEPISEDEIRALFTSEGLATQTYVDNAVSNVPTTDLTGYATETYVGNKVDSIPATDLSNYYTKDETYSKTEVDTLVANSGGSSSGGEEWGGETPTPMAHKFPQVGQKRLWHRKGTNFSLPHLGQPNIAPPKEGSPQLIILSTFSITEARGCNV